MPRRSTCFGALVALLLLPAFAVAETTAVHAGLGPRVGFSSGPDQFVFGGQLTVGEIAPHITFDPSIEFGFGDDVTTIAGNADLHYHFPLKGYAWTPYAGAGATIVNYSHDKNPPERDDSHTDAGGSLIVGAGAATPGGNRFFSEIHFGLGDVPSFKLMVGWNFKI